MSLFTCITCHVTFQNPELQRDHYKSDWHRYNLKRKIAELPSITNEAFLLKVSFVNENAQNVNEESYCEVCRKYFNSKNAFKNHFNSKKHRQSVSNKKDTVNESPENSASTPKVKPNGKPKTLAADIVAEEIDSADDDSDWESCDDDDAISEVMCCIFCSHENVDLDSNIQHMSTVHSFFIPDIEYVVDLPGLVAYLYEKVTVGCICTWCRKEFNNEKSAQQHMMDTGHCKISYEGKYCLEYADFYDYTSSYPIGTSNGDEEVTTDELNEENWELTLPTGAKIGHRSLALYYRQNLPPKRENTKKLIHKVMSGYRAIGWTGGMSATAVQTAKNITYLKKLQAKHSLKLGVRANKLQRHFRPQVTF